MPRTTECFTRVMTRAAAGLGSAPLPPPTDHIRSLGEPLPSAPPPPTPLGACPPTSQHLQAVLRLCLCLCQACMVQHHSSYGTSAVPPTAGKPGASPAHAGRGTPIPQLLHVASCCHLPHQHASPAVLQCNQWVAPQHATVHMAGARKVSADRRRTLCR